MPFKLKMSDTSVFAYLMRSSWWISLAIVVVMVLFMRTVFPEKYPPYAFAIVFPFLITGAIAAWKQLRSPSEARIAATLETVMAMPWREFSTRMEQSFLREGFEVSRTNGAADFRIVKAGNVSLVSCKRWKAASHGLEPLRELERSRQEQAAHEAIYVAAGGVTDTAHRFAVENKIVLMQGPELTELLFSEKGAA